MTKHTCPACGHHFEQAKKVKGGEYKSEPMADRPGWHMWTSPSGVKGAATFPVSGATLAAERKHRKRIARWERDRSKLHDWLPAYLKAAQAWQDHWGAMAMGNEYTTQETAVNNLHTRATYDNAEYTAYKLGRGLLPSWMCI